MNKGLLRASDSMRLALNARRRQTRYLIELHAQLDGFDLGGGCKKRDRPCDIE
jgi:hypothetical protein